MPQYWDKEIETAPRYQMEALAILSIVCHRKKSI